MTNQHYDLIIVGAGAGGGTLAYALANSGQKILLLERGDYVPKEEANRDPDEVFLNQRYGIDEDWYDRESQPFTPEMHYNVGGNTKFYGATLQRMRERDFEALRHHGGVSPAWPISYSDMEPYYTQAENIYKIHGQSGEDPTEPRLSAGDYPYEAIPHEPRIQADSDGLRDRGLNPFHLTIAVDRNPSNPKQSPCIRCDTCDPYPCKIDAKMDAQTACVDKAIAHENVTLLTGVKVEQLHTDASGKKVERIEAKVDGKTQFFSANTVVLSCGAVNSSVLLLKSKSERFPEGLANRSGLVGRNLTKHNHSALVAISAEPNPTKFQKTLGLHDFYFNGPDQDYPLGQVQLTGKAKWQRLQKMAPAELPQPVLEYLAEHSVDWWLTSEDLPDPNNRITVDKSGNIQVHYTSNNLKPHQELIAVMEKHLRGMGNYLFWHKFMGVEVMWHQAGTCVFGPNPETSVLDINCKAHDLDNLYVVDASFMPSMGAVNLTLTIAANALRVADHLKNRWLEANPG